jgi:protein TonB
MINGALLALLVLTLPKAAAPLPDDTLWVSLETAAAETAGAPAMPPPPSAAYAPPAAAVPPVPAVSEAAERPAPPPQAPASPQTNTSDSKPSPATTPSASAAPPQTASRPVQSQAPVQTQSQTQSQTHSQAQSQAVGGGPKHAASYAARVRLHLESFKVYPPQARRRHQTGVVQLTFAIDRQGRVLLAQVTKSSGVAALDQAALDMLAAAQPLPKPPSDVTDERISMTVPVEFGETE